MERNANDFDQVVMNELFGKQVEKPYDPNAVIDEITGQERMRFYDPLSPIINRLHMRPVNNHDDYFGETPAFI